MWNMRKDYLTSLALRDVRCALGQSFSGSDRVNLLIQHRKSLNCDCFSALERLFCHQKGSSKVWGFCKYQPKECQPLLNWIAVYLWSQDCLSISTSSLKPKAGWANSWRDHQGYLWNPKGALRGSDNWKKWCACHSFFVVRSGLSWLGTASCPEAYSPEGDCPWLRDCPLSGCRNA